MVWFVVFDATSNTTNQTINYFDLIFCKVPAYLWLDEGDVD